MMRAIVASGPDPYTLWPATPERNTPYNTTIARTQVTPRLTGGQTTKTIILVGQSNIAAYVGTGVDTPYAPANSNIHNFDISNGGVFEAEDNLLGCNGTVGSVGIRLGDQLITAGWAQRIILAPMAIGGTQIGQWIASTQYGNDIPVMAKRLASVGLVADIVIAAIGESDAAIGTSQAAFTSAYQSMIATFRAAGITCPFLCTLSTYQSGASDATIRAGTSAVPDNVTVFLGADTDGITGAGRSDTTHFTQAGADTAAGLHKDEVVLY